TGAVALEEAPVRAFVSSGDILKAIRTDLDKAKPRDRAFLRYFTLTHLHNAGLSGEEMQSFRHGLSKLVNSLSWENRILIPRAIWRSCCAWTRARVFARSERRERASTAPACRATTA